MAESDTTRFGIRRWSASTDTPSRAEFDAAHAQIELLGAIDKQGTSLPAPGVRGTFYYHETSGLLYRDNGVSWNVVGSSTQDVLVTSSVPANVPLTVKGAAGQSANIFQVQEPGGGNKLAVDPWGNVTISEAYNGQRLNVVNLTPLNPVIQAKAASGQLADLVAIKAFDDTNRFKVTKEGYVESPFLRASFGSSVANGSVASNLANMTHFSATPAFEVQSSKGGAGTFNDLVYLLHQAVDATAVSRRLGFLMKVGGETVADAARTGGMALESSSANFDNPTLHLLRADEKVASFAQDTITLQKPTVTNGNLTINAGSTPSLILSNTRIGVHGTDYVYLRSGGASGGFYWYRGGGHSNTPGDAGGGTTLATLDSAGRFTSTKLTIAQSTGVTLGEGSPALMIGAASGLNLISGAQGLQARNNGAASSLALNPSGGTTNFGGDVVVTGTHRSATNSTTSGHSVASGFSNIYWRAYRNGGLVSWALYVTVTATITVPSNGNLSDKLIATIPAGWRPEHPWTATWGNGLTGGEALVNEDGTIFLRSGAPNVNISSGSNIRLSAAYVVA